MKITVNNIFKKIRKFSFKNTLRVLKDVFFRFKGVKKLSDYLFRMMKTHLELKALTKLFPFDPKPQISGFCFFGYFDEMHDRTTDKVGDFGRVAYQIKEAILKDKNIPIKICVNKYNFFCLDEMVKLCLILKNNNENIQLPRFSIFPVSSIIRNFVNYANEIKEKAGRFKIELILCDDELIDIIRLIQFHAIRNTISDNELVRLLGIISEHAFIGPRTIGLDPYHRCNLKCKHCFVHNPLIKHTQEFLDRKFSYEVFRHIVDDAAELKVDEIVLQGDGEPLLYDNFFDMIRYIRSKNLGVIFFTNGYLIGEKEANEIVELGISEIYCSVPAGTLQTYDEVTSSGTQEAFHTLVRNLKRLSQIKKQKYKKFPRLIMTHVIHTLNHHELVEMAKLDAEIGADAARFYVIRIDDNNKHLKLNEMELIVIKRDLPIAEKIFKESGIEFMNNIEFQLTNYDRKTGSWSGDFFLKQGCIIGWFYCLIPALYDVSMCCHLRTVGYLTKQSFRELWDSREYRRYRIQAKFLKNNREVTFLNGVKLYDEHCEHCDNHPTLLHLFNELKGLGLYKFIK